jgi:ABC-type microcin C transport system permease subunit YejB
MIPEVNVHPLDLSRWQMDLHKDSVYKHAKGTMRCKANKMPQADIQQVIDNISSMIHLSPEVIENMKKQFNTDKKITFDEFLQLLQRQAFFRENLAQA